MSPHHGVLASASPLKAFTGPVAILDLETTGTRPLQDRITEIGLVLADGQGVRTWSALVNPGCRIPAFISRLTGISDDSVRDAPDFAGLADELSSLLEGRLVVAHHARFDLAFLKAEFERLGRAFQARTLCTVRLSRQLSPAMPRHDLDSVIACYGLAAKTRHRALDDATAVYEFLREAEARHGADAVAAAIHNLGRRASLPAYLDAGLPDQLPASPGVYFFHGEAGLLYVGKAKNIRTRVLSHFTADLTDAKEMRLSQQVRRITWETTAGELGALLREARYVKQLQPLLNRQLRRQARLGTMVLRPDPDGLLRPAYVTGNDLAGADRRHGLFNSRAAMITYLRGMATSHGLCDYALGLAPRAARPCPSRQLKRCRGLCDGSESVAEHNQRLIQAVEADALVAWPFPGRVVLAEHNPRTLATELHVVDNWCWLGSAGDEPSLRQLLDTNPEPVLDKDTYRLLVKAVHGSGGLEVRLLDQAL